MMESKHKTAWAELQASHARWLIEAKQHQENYPSYNPNDGDSLKEALEHYTSIGLARDAIYGTLRHLPTWRPPPQ